VPLLVAAGDGAAVSAPAELIGVAVVLVGRGEGDVALAPAVELPARGELEQQLVALQQHAPFPGPHQLPRLGVVHGDPVVEVAEQHHAAASTQERIRSASCCLLFVATGRRFSGSVVQSSGNLLMVKNLLGHFTRCPRAAGVEEARPREDVRRVGVPALRVAVLAAGGQVAADEAEARVVQQEPDRHRALRRSVRTPSGEWPCFLFLLRFTVPVRGDSAAYLVAEPAKDAGADGGDAGVADVPAEAAPRPDGDEDADHLLAHDAPEHALSVIHRCSSRRVFSILHAPPAVQCVLDEPLPLHGCRSLLGAEHAPRVQWHDLLEPAPCRSASRIFTAAT
jgi:hypothetical protein